MIDKKRFYLFFSIILILGLCWLFISIFLPSFAGVLDFCPIEWMFGIPCPACGSTRSTIAILNGEFLDALDINPLGYIVLGLTITIAILLPVDLILKKDYLYTLYHKTESVLKMKWIAIILVIFVTLIWIRNIAS